MTFICKQTEKDFRETMPKNFKSLKTEVEEDIRRWRDCPCSWMGRINSKMAVLSKLNVILIKFQSSSCQLVSRTTCLPNNQDKPQGYSHRPSDSDKALVETGFYLQVTLG